jgi:hypothetical protein
MIRKYYGRSIVALLLIPVVTVSAAGIDYMIDPELARGHPHYVRNFAPNRSADPGWRWHCSGRLDLPC